MKRPRVRITVRQMMVAVAVVATGLEKVVYHAKSAEFKNDSLFN
jgi:hypothetical protein